MSDILIIINILVIINNMSPCGEPLPTTGYSVPARLVIRIYVEQLFGSADGERRGPVADLKGT